MAGKTRLSKAFAVGALSGALAAGLVAGGAYWSATGGGSGAPLKIGGLVPIGVDAPFGPSSDPARGGLMSKYDADVVSRAINDWSPDDGAPALVAALRETAEGRNAYLGTRSMRRLDGYLSERADGGAGRLASRLPDAAEGELPIAMDRDERCAIADFAPLAGEATFRVERCR